MSDRVEKLKLKKKQIEARIKKMETAEKNKSRKADTRRKILVGAYMLDKATKEGGIKELYAQVKGFLTRENDKRFFEEE